MNAPIRARGLRPWGLAAAAPALDIEVGEGLTVLLGEAERVEAYLRALIGIDPAEGELALLGRPSSGLDEAAWIALRRELAFVPRAGSLVSVMDGWRNILLPADFHGLADQKTLEARLLARIEECGFALDLRRLPAAMSPLERRCAAILRALLLEPKVLCLEAPFHGLDSAGQLAVAGYLRGLAERGQAVLVAVDAPALARAARPVFIGEESIVAAADWAALTGTDAPEFHAFLRLHARAHGLTEV